MKAKHTPGPWAVEDPMFGELTIVETGKQTYEWRFIASIDISPNDPDHSIPIFEAKANARLISAAPDLLAALKELVGQRDAHFHTLSAWDAARAAIAKAEGSQS